MQLTNPVYRVTTATGQIVPPNNTLATHTGLQIDKKGILHFLYTAGHTVAYN